MTRGRAPTLGIDFGTSNSAVAVLDDGGAARALALEGGATTLPTAIFFNAEDRSVHFGRDAVALYLQGVDGRLMRSLKSLLGSSLMQESTAIGWGSASYQDILSRFLAELAERARAQVGELAPEVLLGRPVHFVDDSPERDRQAQESLRRAAIAAGFRDVRFELEPIAAAFDYERRLERESLVLIVDIGGGTSDFTVVRLGPDRVAHTDRRADVLATAGVHVAGTDFDRKLNLARVMPLLGLGHHGPVGRPVPSPVFMELATWHLINFLYAPKVMARVRALRTNFSDTQLHDRLLRVLELRLGHRIASEVELAKIACSSTGETARLALDEVEAGLEATLDAPTMAAELAPLLDQVVACARECVRAAQAVAPDAIYLTGGSSALQPLQGQLRAGFPGVPLVEGDLFGGVAAGLAYAAAHRH
ncbi:Hsp70 family protein [Ramlibacter algicola]|uniref:Hsp70 family protein n=1 Tax=Ramlibacter algicola TaxID=2795217 RepID=A0A934Q3Q9_9BURK|nr:Hsp70 family protein [Ramlibacter algicola]MBK0394308.1 Hsp70 family protein [Ramlibacter algicola]